MYMYVYMYMCNVVHTCMYMYVLRQQICAALQLLVHVCEVHVYMHKYTYMYIHISYLMFTYSCQ